MNNTTLHASASHRLLGLCRKGLVLGLLVGGTALLTTQVNSVAQSASGQAGDATGQVGDAAGQMDEQMQQMMAMMERYGMPGEQHKELEKMVGTWKTEIRHWMEPGTEPQISKGTATYSMILDGHYLIGHHHSDWDGMPFEGIEVIGYDRFRERTFTYWFDNMSTGVMAMRSRDGDSDITSATMRGTMDDYMTGRKDIKIRSKSTMNSDDHAVYVMEMELPDGTMFKAIEVESWRNKDTTPTGAATGAGKK